MFVLPAHRRVPVAQPVPPRAPRLALMPARWPGSEQSRLTRRPPSALQSLRLKTTAAHKTRFCRDAVCTQSDSIS